MNIRSAIAERLLGDPGVIATACVGVRPVQAAQDDVFLPDGSLVVYERTGGASLQTTDGSTSTRQDTFAFYCFAGTDQRASDLGDAVLASLTDPAWIASSDGTVKIHVVTDTDDSDGTESPLHAMELAPYRVDVSLQIVHT